MGMACGDNWNLWALQVVCGGKDPRHLFLRKILGVKVELNLIFLGMNGVYPTSIRNFENLWIQLTLAAMLASDSFGCCRQYFSASARVIPISSHRCHRKNHDEF